MFQTETGTSVLRAVDYMDDGTPVSLSLSLSIPMKGLQYLTSLAQAIFYPATERQLQCTSCSDPLPIIYCLRCMVGYDVPSESGGWG